MKTILYITGFLFASYASFATGGDTTKVKYDINDPRNPDCPCHKYQQLADEEYQRMLGENAIQDASENVANRINQTKEKTAPDIAAAAAEDAGAKMTATSNKTHTTKEKMGPIGTATTAAGNADAKMVKDSDKTSGTKKVSKSAFRHRSGSHHGNTQPKKRKIRFGRKDNSRCTHW
jgi:hypothetical protein